MQVNVLFFKCKIVSKIDNILIQYLLTDNFIVLPSELKRFLLLFSYKLKIF